MPWNKTRQQVETEALKHSLECLMRWQKDVSDRLRLYGLAGGAPGCNVPAFAGHDDLRRLEKKIDALADALGLQYKHEPATTKYVKKEADNGNG